MQNILNADPMLQILLVGLALVAVLAVVVVVVVLRTTRGAATLQARLDMIAQDQEAKSATLSQRLMDHERAIADRLADVGRRVGDSLTQTNDKTNENLSKLRERLAKIDAAQANITELSSRVVSLQDILSNKQSRGAFGEFQLGQLVADALPADSYDFEVTLSNGRRVDCLIRLPNPPGPVAVDAKFPLEGYQALVEAKDETSLKEASRAFRTAITKHVGDISERYVIPGETAEAALLFLPSESIYIELQSNFRDLVELAHRKRVYIVSPTTLWGALATMRAVFRDVRLREQTHLIQAELQKMLKDVGLLDERVSNLQRHFDQASEDIRQIRISNDKVAKRAGRMSELELEEDEAPSVAAVEPPARAHLREV
jgi:DNA recombination protein RmuC